MNENLFNFNLKGKIVVNNDRYLNLDMNRNPYLMIKTLDNVDVISYPDPKFLDYLNNNKELLNKENIFRGQLLTFQDMYDNNLNRLVFNKLIGIDNDAEETKEIKLNVNCFKVFDNVSNNYQMDNFLLVKLKKYDNKITLKLSYKKLNVPLNEKGHPDLISTMDRYLPIQVSFKREKSSYQITNISFL